MAKLMDTLTDLINDVELFCTVTLHTENLSKSAQVSRDVLLEKLAEFKRKFPPNNLKNDCPLPPEPISPPPYLDMKGSSNKNNLDYVFSDSPESNYEICEVDNNENSLEVEPKSEEPCYDMPSSTVMTNAVMKGYLEKKSRGLFNQYQKRWCVLTDGVLYYYTHITDTRQCGSVHLSGYEIRSISGQAKDIKRDSGFELVCPGRRTYQFLAPNKEILQKWIAAIDAEATAKKNQAGNDTQSNAELLPKSADEDYEIYETLEEDIQETKSNNSNTKVSGNIKHEEWYLGMWDCIADDPNELSFTCGQLIRVISKEYDEFSWWVGEIRGNRGLVPKNFLTDAYEIVTL